jgi:hypothetical protein
MAKTLELNKIAEILKVHPRTFLRAYAGDVCAYWAPGYNPEYTYDDISLTYGIDPKLIDKLVAGKDELLNTKEAVAQISLIENREVPERTFHYRKYPAVIKKIKVVRYSRLALCEYHIEKYVEE